MRVYIVAIFLALISLLSGSLTLAAPSSATPRFKAPTPPPFINNQILVAFKPGAPASAVADAHRQSGGRPIKTITALGVQLVGVPANSVLEKLAVYRRNPNVRYAEPNYIRTMRPPQVNVIPQEGSGFLLGPYFEHQWGMHNTGQEFYYSGLSGTADADIDAPEGWDALAALGVGAPMVKVAVLDTGVDCAHVDLRLDDGSSKCLDRQNYTTSPTVDDLFGHGTHVAGIIAANTDNAIGVAGVAEIAYLGSFKVCDDTGSCPDDAILSGLSAAADAGYHVVNMSFGGPEASSALADAVAYAWNSGVVLVSSAGNEGSANIGYPARLAQVIAVASSDANDNRSSFSNFGDLVSVTAPGDIILSTVPMAYCPGDAAGCYEFYSGTSMASPHVAGIAALVWARDDVTSNAQVRTIIENSTDTNGAAGQNLLNWTEHGRVNLYSAITYPLTTENSPPVAAFTYSCNSLSCGFSGTASHDPDGTITAYAWDFGDGVNASGSTTNHSYATAGTYTVSLSVTDDDSESTTATASVRVKAKGKSSGGTGGTGGDSTDPVTPFCERKPDHPKCR